MPKPKDASLSDEEFAAIRAQVESCCSPSLLTIMHQAVFDLIPETFQGLLNTYDPRRVSVRAGERIGQAIGLGEEQLKIFAFSFGTRVWGISAEQTKRELNIRSSAPTSSRDAEFDSASNALIGVAERLASTFTLPDLTPTQARRLITVAAADLSREES